LPPDQGSANHFIEEQLHSRIEGLENAFEAHAISFSGPILFGTDDILRSAIEDKHKDKKHRDEDKLIFILTTTGGYIEVVQRVVATLRKHYKVVDFVVPNHAFSAGTVLVMSGDAIYMDYYSRLGPIDPQVETQSGKMVPALGYLERYNDLIEKAHTNKITTAEVQLLIEGFDQAELYQYEQARELSRSLLRDWLVRYKFKNWNQTRTRKKPVTNQMKTARADKIANQLNKTAKWHSHGHGISKEVLDKDLDLIIDDFGLLAPKIREYHELLSDYMAKQRTRGTVHFKGSYRPFM
jgi:membrane-bound ClpP family serine protease